MIRKAKAAGLSTRFYCQGRHPGYKVQEDYRKRRGSNPLESRLGMGYFNPWQPLKVHIRKGWSSAISTIEAADTCSPTCSALQETRAMEGALEMPLWLTIA